MHNEEIELSLLSEENIWNTNGNTQLDVIKKYGPVFAYTDLTALTGGRFTNNKNGIFNAPDSIDNIGRSTVFYTKTKSYLDGVRVNDVGIKSSSYSTDNNIAVLPVLKSNTLFSRLLDRVYKGYNDTLEVEFGEYPQYAPNRYMQFILEYSYLNNEITKTGKTYTLDESANGTYEEYSYLDGKYIRIKANLSSMDKYSMSHGDLCSRNDVVWVKVSPLKWLVDEKTKMLISKRILLSGVRFCDNVKNYDGDFENTEMYNYLNTYMLRDILQNEKIIDKEEENVKVKKKGL